MSIATLHEAIIRATWQARCNSWSIQAASAKAYDAPWLKDAGKVMRGPDGRFARDVSSIADKIGRQSANIREAIAQLDIPATQQREARSLRDRIFKEVGAQHPDFMESVTDMMFGKGGQELRDREADKYQEVNPEFANAMRQDPFAEMVGRAKMTAGDIGRAMDWSSKEYQKGLKKLRHLKGPEAVRTLGKLAAFGISTAVTVTANVGPEVALAVALSEPLGVAIASAGAGALVGWGLSAAMDAAKIKNKNLRFAIQTVAGFMVGSAVTGGLRNMREAAEALREAAWEKSGKAAIAKKLFDENGIEMPSPKSLKAAKQKPIGAGAMGEVFKDPDKALVYKFGNNRFHMPPEEAENAMLAGLLSIGPKVRAMSKDGYAMDFLEGYKPFVGGDAMGRLINRGDFADFGTSDVGKMFDMAANQVGRLHKAGIQHQDIHFQNLMFSEGMNDVKLIDFGLARKVSRDNRNTAFRSDLDRMAVNFHIAKAKSAEKQIDELIEKHIPKASRLRKEQARIESVFAVVQRLSREANLDELYTGKLKISRLTDEGVNAMIDKNMREYAKRMKMSLGQADEKFRAMVEEETILNLGIKIPQELAPVAAASGNLKDLLRERKYRLREHLENPSTESRNRLLEIEVAIAMCNEELTADDAYGMMAE